MPGVLNCEYAGFFLGRQSLRGGFGRGGFSGEQQGDEEKRDAVERKKSGERGRGRETWESKLQLSAAKQAADSGGRNYRSSDRRRAEGLRSRRLESSMGRPVAMLSLAAMPTRIEAAPCS